jgi:uncharacterized protein YgbK (DUF1537 family)
MYIADRHFPVDAPPISSTDSIRLRSAIRNRRLSEDRRTLVLDDDPTGSQAVHDVSIVTVLEPEVVEQALDAASATCFVLTNTRSMSEHDATAVNAVMAGPLMSWAAHSNLALEVVSRSDSTLRGHVIAEVRSLEATRKATLGRGYDGVLLAPAFFEAGRFTLGDIQWVTVGGRVVPMAESEFAHDASFGYRSSNLRNFLYEKSNGELSVDDILSVSLNDIRVGGIDAVAEVLRTARDCRFIVINCLEYSDLDVVVSAVQLVEGEGRRVLCRTGPSFVRALMGLEDYEPLHVGGLSVPVRPGHGLVIVGSHVAQTGRQLAGLSELHGLKYVEVSVRDVIDDARRENYLQSTAERLREALITSDVVLVTSRIVVAGKDADDSLRISRVVSSALVELTRRALDSRPIWVIAKGGITSHDIAASALGIRRAVVLGQLFPGMISVLRPIDASEKAVGVPYIVFAGNVGGDRALADVVTALRHANSVY